MMLRSVMPALPTLLALLTSTALAPAAWAQVPAYAARPPAPAPSAASAASATMRTSASPAIARQSAAPASPGTTEVRVIDDDRVRIEETRLRGQLARVIVSPKGSTLAPYEINVGTGGRDPSQDKSGAGQRVWSVFRF